MKESDLEKFKARVKQLNEQTQKQTKLSAVLKLYKALLDIGFLFIQLNFI